MIHTSYYANIPAIKKELNSKEKLVSISLYPPSYLKSQISHAPELAPSKKLLADYKNGLVNDEQYTEIYINETLSKLNPAEIFKKYDGKVFLCFEKTGDFCHRNIVSKWLRDNGFESGEIVKKNKTLRLAIIGSRDFDNYPLLKKIIDKFIQRHSDKDIVLVSGGARGADSLARRYAQENSLRIDEYFADWDKFGKSAGYKRNHTIWENSDMGIAFWDGESKGTQHSFSLSASMGKRLYIFNYNKMKFVPRVVVGNIFESNADIISFTANSITAKSKLVMGAGCAKAFKTRFPVLPERFAFSPNDFGFKVVRIRDNGKMRLIGAFQSKIDFKSDSTIEIISNSVQKLKEYIKENGNPHIAICFPGILNGNLKETDVIGLFDGLSVDLYKLGK